MLLLWPTWWLLSLKVKLSMQLNQMNINSAPGPDGFGPA
jgi:hypothetical protein